MVCHNGGAAYLAIASLKLAEGRFAEECMRYLGRVIFLIASLSLLSCVGGSGSGSIPIGKAGQFGSNIQQPNTPPATQSTEPIISVKVGTVWESSASACNFSSDAVLEGSSSGETQFAACDKVTKPQATCEIAAGTAMLPYDPSGSGSSLNCRVKIPEIQLYYSSLRFDVKIADKSCAVVVFRPYWYRASSAAAFTPRWGTTAIDCSVADAPVECYSGPATKMVSQFPTYTAHYSVFGNSAGRWNLKTDSANKLNPALSNRFLSNYMESSYRNCSNGDLSFSGDGWPCTSTPNGFSDYVVSCQDEYGLEKWVLTILIEDVDDSGAAYPLGYNTLTANQKASWPH